MFYSQVRSIRGTHYLRHIPQFRQPAGGCRGMGWPGRWSLYNQVAPGAYSEQDRRRVAGCCRDMGWTGRWSLYNQVAPGAYSEQDRQRVAGGCRGMGWPGRWSLYNQVAPGAYSEQDRQRVAGGCRGVEWPGSWSLYMQVAPGAWWVGQTKGGLWLPVIGWQESPWAAGCCRSVGWTVFECKERWVLSCA